MEYDVGTRTEGYVQYVQYVGLSWPYTDQNPSGSARTAASQLLGVTPCLFD